jgi:acetolactate synthase-1/2/3 large subunit
MNTRVHGRGYQQDLDPVKIFGPITKYSTRVTRPDRLPEELFKSIRIATCGRPGPVHLDLPIDVLDTIVEAEIRLPNGSHAMRPPRITQIESIQAATNLLLLAESPVILAGGAVILSGASRELLQFAELLSIPVGTSYNGRGAIPEDHPLALCTLGEFTPRACSDLVSQADVLFVLGYRFTDVSMDGWSPGCRC